MKHSYAPKSDVLTRGLSFNFAPVDWLTRGDHFQWIFVGCCVCAFIAGSFLAHERERWPYVLVLTALLFAACSAASPKRALTSIRRSRNKEKHPCITEEQNASSGLVYSEEVFRSVFDHAASMALMAPNGRWVTVNQSLCEVLGYAENELLKTSLADIVHPDDLEPLFVQIKKLQDGCLTSSQMEQRYLHKLGHVVWVLLNISMIRTSQGAPAFFVFQIHDITERKKAEERLVHDVFHDALTGLPNRALFMDRLKLAVERIKRRKEQLFTVAFLDLDRFKAVNDSMGHIIGDQLLIEVARRLKTCLRTTDTVARLGGDEFTILLEDITDENESIRIVERLQKELARPFKLGFQEISISVSIGVASSFVGYERAEDILRDADSAMYRAKSAGKARYEVFDKVKHAHPTNILHLETDLEQAIERRQLFLYYQPIVSLQAGKLSGFEALVRWRHPQRGLISPADFIPLAEDNGAIVTIGQWVLREACNQLRHWRKQFPFNRSLSISVNLSSKQFMQAGLTDQIIDLLRETHLDPRMLRLEITESVVMENIGAATVLLQQLRALGVELGIDDFGTGYSSLSYLHRLPINTLKIDKSFVSRMVENEDNAEIIKTIITLARSLGMSVVAEGIETLEQLAQLRRLRCDAGQGYLFSKPIDAEAAGTLIGIRTQWQTTFDSLVNLPTSLHPGESHQQYVPTTSLRRHLLKAV